MWLRETGTTLADICLSDTATSRSFSTHHQVDHRSVPAAAPIAQHATHMLPKQSSLSWSLYFSLHHLYNHCYRQDQCPPLLHTRGLTCKDCPRKVVSVLALEKTSPTEVSLMDGLVITGTRSHDSCTLLAEIPLPVLLHPITGEVMYE